MRARGVVRVRGIVRVRGMVRVRGIVRLRGIVRVRGIVKVRGIVGFSSTASSTDDEYCRHFVEKFSEIVKPLASILSYKVIFHWGKDQELVIVKLKIKDAICKASEQYWKD